MMRWIKFTLGALAAASAAFGFGWVRGGQLPETRVTSVTAMFNCAPETLWDLVDQLEKQPTWKSSMISSTLVSTDPDVWEEDYDGTKIRLKTTERVVGEKLVRTLDDPGLPYQGSWTYAVSSAGENKAQLILTETSSIENKFVRFIAQGILGLEDSLKETISEMQTKLGPAKFLPKP